MPQLSFLVSVLCITALNVGVAQKSFLFKGEVRDAESAQAIPGVIVGYGDKGVATDDSGKFWFTYAKPVVAIRLSMLGYESKELQINHRNIHLIQLSPLTGQLQEVVINEQLAEQKVNAVQMSTESISIEESRLLPAFMGETDIIKTLQLKPGVQSGTEGSAGLFVRGGSADQNLVMLDGVTLYNPNHLFGFFSVFNSDAVSGVELYKGDFPARFGGRLSSVIDVTGATPAKDTVHATGGIGLISSRLSVSAPIVKNRGGVQLSGRRTYSNIFTNLYNKTQEGQPDFSPIPDYYFYDLNLKADYRINDNNTVFVTAYYGRDRFKFSRNNFNFAFNWGNTAGIVRWNKRYSNKLYGDAGVFMTQYDYIINTGFSNFAFELSSKINDLGVKYDFIWLPADKHTITFGAAFTRHSFTIGRLQAGTGDGAVDVNAGLYPAANEYGAYVDYETPLLLRLTLHAGLRLSALYREGHSLFAPEPRLSLNYKISEAVSFKTSYALMQQYIHLVSNSASSLPTDVWYPAGQNVKPQTSQQLAGGMAASLFNGRLYLSNEYYYKWMTNVSDFRDNAQLFLNPAIENEFVFGRGESYGTEIYVEKKSGRLRGWVGYTLAWAWRHFDEINNGKRFHPTYDRRHDISVALIYTINKRNTLSGTWVYGTGAPTTLPSSRLLVSGIPGGNSFVVPIYNERNGYRMNNYHRLDISYTRSYTHRWGTSDLVIGVYNLYDRRNPYFIYFEEQKNEEETRTLGFVAKQVSLFPVLPSIAWNFKF